MPDDIKAIVVNIVRGHARRIAEYQDKMQEATQSSPQPFDTYRARVGKKRDDGTYSIEERYSYHGHSSDIGRPTEGVQARLDAIENHPDTKRMRAVEQAKHGIGRDLPDEQRAKLTDAIWDSCIYGRNFIFCHYHLPMHKATFYERRREFLWDIATELGYLEAE